MRLQNQNHFVNANWHILSHPNGFHTRKRKTLAIALFPSNSISFLMRWELKTIENEIILFNLRQFNVYKRRSNAIFPMPSSSSSSTVHAHDCFSNSKIKNQVIFFQIIQFSPCVNLNFMNIFAKTQFIIVDFHRSCSK